MNGLASDFHFLNLDRHEWNERDLLIFFLKKLLFGSMGEIKPENGVSP